MSSNETRQLADLKRALDHAAIVAITDVTGTITYVNEKFCEISGYSRDELIGQDHRIVNSAYHPKEFIRELWRTIGNGHVWHGELRNRAKGGHFYWVDTTIVPFLDDRGKPYQYIAIRADISARKAAEEKLVRQAALAQVGEMAAIVAHEVRNPLAGIKGAIQVLMSRGSLGNETLVLMRDIVERVDSLGELINDLMIFARPRPPRLEPVDLHRLIDEAIAFTRRGHTDTRLEIALEGHTGAVTADGELIRATVMNLLINAAQALNGHGRIVVRTAMSDEFAVVEVQDDGPGIPADIRPRVMDPFFTTKTRGGGLGLAIARRTAELHGGSLTLACPESGGTVVTLTLARRAPSAVATGR